jgi:D-alanine-D-alanine ligase
MPKRLRIAILYNEPVTGANAARKYITENGQLKEGPLPLRETKGALAGKTVPVDLSEVGVMEEMDDIRVALNSLGYKTTVFNVDSDMVRMIDYLREEKPDLVFNIVECVENESIQEMNVAGVFELLKIPYTGAPPLALGIALNKPLVKEILSFHGVKTPRFQVFQPATRIVVDGSIPFPLIVKPSHEDASVGIADASVVYTPNDLRKRIRYIFEEFGQAALVEQYVEGRELNVAIIGNREPIALPISEIDFSGLAPGMQKIVSYEAKWIHGTVAYEGTKGVCPAPLTAQQESRLKEIALKCYRLIGCRDYARVDFRMTKEGVPYVLEVNPNPDISDEAGFARSARAYGLSFPDIVGKIVEYALERAHPLARA